MTESPKRWIRAAEGRRVRDPDTKALLPDEGIGVVWSTHWQRRLDDADIVESDAPAQAEG